MEAESIGRSAYNNLPSPRPQIAVLRCQLCHGRRSSFYHRNTNCSLRWSVFPKCNIKNRKLEESAKAGPRHLELHVLARVNRSVEGYRDVQPEEITHGVHDYLIPGSFLRLLVPYGH